MVKANELRMGNWVQHLDREIYQSTEYTQLGIFRDGLKVFPIPLTEEWLLKFGFKEFVKSRFRKDITNKWINHKCNTVTDGEQLMEIMIDTDDTNYLSLVYFIDDDPNQEESLFRGDCVDYVHQLQNLYFALTGEELTIK